MKEIVVISGKGGTGKTTVAAAFASLATDQMLCDADVDAADLHLILAPNVLERHDFMSGHKAAIDLEVCTRCGLCRDLCRFEAISAEFEVSELDCEGCGVCEHFCPEDAIRFPLQKSGEWFFSETRFGPMVHARLGIAQENSGKLVATVRQEARRRAGEQGIGLILTDGPPGVGCPVIAAIGGVSAVLIVSEPTVAGRHDMERVAGLAAHFGVPAFLTVNKWDLNPGHTEAMEAYAREGGIAVMERIPFDADMVRSMVQGQTVCEYAADGSAAQALRRLWTALTARLGDEG